MANYIPFVNGSRDLALCTRFFSDAEITRVPLDVALRYKDRLKSLSGLWLDATVDAFEGGPNERWNTYARQFSGANHIAAVAADQLKPAPKIIQQFVDSVLDLCLGLSPRWISVPQLPYRSDSTRNSVNRALAKAAGTWKSTRSFPGALVLPVVLRHQDQANSKTMRKQKIALATSCFELSGSASCWVVESSLRDWEGSGNFATKRFPGVIAFHEELRSDLAKTGSRAFVIGGPYWALNLVLWARGAIDCPAIGVGGGFQYFLRSGVAQTPSARIALGPLRRLARAGADLRVWLSEAAKVGGPAAPTFRHLSRELQRTAHDENAGRSQIAQFYKAWFDQIASAKPTGRALALFQDFSAAYVLGKSVSALLPAAEAPARRPERIAEQMMLQCLSG